MLVFPDWGDIRVQHPDPNTWMVVLQTVLEDSRSPNREAVISRNSLIPSGRPTSSSRWNQEHAENMRTISDIVHPHPASLPQLPLMVKNTYIKDINISSVKQNQVIETPVHTQRKPHLLSSKQTNDQIRRRPHKPHKRKPGNRKQYKRHITFHAISSTRI